MSWKKFAVFVILALGLLFVALRHFGWLEWPFQEASQLAVAGVGFWTNAAGLLLTVIGFSITIWQLDRAKTLAQTAQDEVRRIQLSLNAYDLAQEASRAEYALRATRKYLRAGLWSEAADSYEDFRRGLSALRANGAPIAEDQNTRIDEASAYILKLCVRIERDIQRGESTVDVAKTVSVIRGHDELIGEIATAIHRGVVK